MSDVLLGSTGKHGMRRASQFHFLNCPTFATFEPPLNKDAVRTNYFNGTYIASALQMFLNKLYLHLQTCSSDTMLRILGSLQMFFSLNMSRL